MEVDDGDDPIKVWQDPKAYPPIPSDFIPCPLNESQLDEPYSLSTQGKPSFYSKQEEALSDFFTKPPLTKPIPTSSSKRAKSNMRPLALETINMRVRTMDEFIGFCTKWLHLMPTMEHAMDPQVVAKYMGFHVAKGTQHSTLKRISTHLHQSIIFVNSEHCPRKHQAQDGATHKSTMDWFTNLNGSLLASISTHFKARDKGITLWSVWEATLSQWEAFQAKLNVSVVGSWGGWVDGWLVDHPRNMHTCTLTTFSTTLPLI